jgi:exopolysaccharide biosynthesis predicted pyruvyltransferase EpsI
VSGQGDIEGIRYGHAFIVDDVFVYDYSNNRKIVLPKSIYFRIGKIIEKKPIFYKYTFEEAMKKMRDTMNYGPWDLKTTSGL